VARLGFHELARIGMKAKKSEVFSNNAPLCWCGASLIPAGIGKYPYPCKAQDKHPGDMVFIGCVSGHTGWDHFTIQESAEALVNRIEDYEDEEPYTYIFGGF